MTITNIGIQNAGDYFVIVGDSTGAFTSRVATLTVILPVALNPKVGANIRLGEDPPELPSNGRAQKEPHLARNYFDSNLIVAAFMEGQIPEGVALGCGYAISRD